MRDLSEVHGPVRHRDHGDPKRYEFTAEQLDEFHTRGYLAGIPVLSDEELVTDSASKPAPNTARCKAGNTIKAPVALDSNSRGAAITPRSRW